MTETETEREANTLRIGTRGSLLARTQTETIVERLRRHRPELKIHVEIIQTTGDLRQGVPFAQVGTKGMFVKEIETALLTRAIDVGVHSLKDMPGELPDGLELACVPEREDPRDALLSRDGAKLTDLPPGAVVGTSSIRRQAQLRHFRPDLRVVELRGNLDTRLAKLDAGQYDAIVLAVAGLNRLGLAARISEYINTEVCLPAVGQGALALETRTGDAATLAWLAQLHDDDTERIIAAERGFQARLHGGCTVPVGALATLSDNRQTITLRGIIAAPDGSALLRDEMSGPVQMGAAIGVDVAERLLARGGAAFLEAKGHSL